MDFPIDLIESIPGAIKTVTQSVDIAKWIADQYQKRRASREPNETQDDDSMDDCFLKTLYLFRQESERKKLEYIKCFAQNTILSDTCPIDTDGILSLLTDIEQMNWRQLCLIEGFNRRYRQEIEIIGMDTSNINGTLMLSDIKKLVNLNYLYTNRDGFYFQANGNRLVTDDIGGRKIGEELAMLMDLKSIPNEEIARAFGPGMIKQTITY